jgi:hypothetical protein
MARQEQESYVRLRTSFFVDNGRQESLPLEDVAAIVR